MSIRRQVSVFTAGLLVVLCAVTGSSAFAQETDEPTRGITVLPPNITLDAEPGASIERSVAVENTTTVEQNIRVSIRNFKPDGEEGAAAPTEEDSPYSMVSWIEVESDNFTLQPGERRDVMATVEVPENAEPGSHFGSIIFTPSSPQDSGGAFSVTTEVASLILLKVPGDARQSAAVESFDVDVAGGDSGPVVFGTRLRNDGNVHFVPQGQITVSDTFGREVAVIPVNVESRPVLPGAVRRFDASWDAGFLLGRYTAELDLAYPDNVAEQPARQLTSAKTFYVLPPLLIGGVVVVLVLLIAAVALRVRKHKRNKAGEESAGRRFAQ